MKDQQLIPTTWVSHIVDGCMIKALLIDDGNGNKSIRFIHPKTLIVTSKSVTLCPQLFHKPKTIS